MKTKMTGKCLMMAMVIGVMAMVLLPQKTYAYAQADIGWDYILPDSDTVYLTLYDLQGLTLQGVNYAKNEIYARHGRMFASQELSDYFNTKTWYRGTVSPSDFSDQVFNDYEQQNLALLDEVEFTVTSKGYQLDQPGYDIYDIWDYTDVEYYESYEPVYCESVYVIPDSDSRYLSESEISGMTLKQLCYARNEIYARHGYIFKSHELQDYFDQQSWYCGYVEAQDFDMSVLNACESANSSLLYGREYSLSATGYALY